MKVNLYTLERVELPEETLGSWYDYGRPDPLLAKTMELPNKSNQRSISCISYGVYRVTKEPPIPKDDPRIERPYWHFRLHEVFGRDGILIHPATYVHHLKGCIGVGSRFVDLNNDNVPDLVESKKKLDWLVSYLPDLFYLEIIKKP
jgi:hypothetical protein